MTFYQFYTTNQNRESGPNCKLEGDCEFIVRSQDSVFGTPRCLTSRMDIENLDDTEEEIPSQREEEIKEETKAEVYSLKD